MNKTLTPAPPARSRERLIKTVLQCHQNLFPQHFTVGSVSSLRDDKAGCFVTDLDDIRARSDMNDSRGIFINYGLNGYGFVPIIEPYHLDGSGLVIRRGNAYLAGAGNLVPISDTQRDHWIGAYRSRVMVVAEYGAPPVSVNSVPPAGTLAHPYGICYHWERITDLIDANIQADTARDGYRIIITCLSMKLMPNDGGGEPVIEGLINRHILALYMARPSEFGHVALLDDSGTTGYAMKAADYGGSCPPNIPLRM